METSSGSGRAELGHSASWANNHAHSQPMNMQNIAIKSGGVNKPDPHEFWTLKPGEKKVEHEPDTRTANTEIFTIRAEDHTIGNLIRDALIAMPEVTFAAYKCPHPLDNRVLIRIQVDPKSDMTPTDAFKIACEESIKNLEIFWRRFKTSYDLTRLSQENQGQGAA